MGINGLKKETQKHMCMHTCTEVHVRNSINYKYLLFFGCLNMATEALLASSHTLSV